jgi:hypothetical protein
MYSFSPRISTGQAPRVSTYRSPPPALNVASPVGPVSRFHEMIEIFLLLILANEIGDQRFYSSAVVGMIQDVLDLADGHELHIFPHGRRERIAVERSLRTLICMGLWPLGCSGNGGEFGAIGAGRPAFVTSPVSSSWRM